MTRRTWILQNPGQSPVANCGFTAKKKKIAQNFVHEGYIIAKPFSSDLKLIKNLQQLQGPPVGPVTGHVTRK